MDLKCDSEQFFDCLNGECIAKDKVCNGVADCKNIEDERRCEHQQVRIYFCLDKCFFLLYCVLIGYYNESKYKNRKTQPKGGEIWLSRKGDRCREEKSEKKRQVKSKTKESEK